MIKEFAVEPEVMATWRHFNVLFSELGASKGRFVTEYPGNWRKRVFELVDAKEGTSELGSVHAKSIKEKLAAKRQQILIPSRGRDYNPNPDPNQMNWLTNAESQQQQHPFDGILARENPRSVPSVYKADDFDRDAEPWKVSTQREIPRTARDLVACAELLLAVSDELVLVDRNFDPVKKRFRDPFAGLLGSRAAGKRWKRCELHLAHPLEERSGNLDKAALKNRIHHFQDYLPTLIPKGNDLEVFFWIRKGGGKRLHPRFILTEIGGLQLDYGLDEGDSLGDTMIVSLMAEAVWESARNDYCSASQSFDITPDCRVSIAGQK